MTASFFAAARTRCGGVLTVAALACVVLAVSAEVSSSSGSKDSVSKDVSSKEALTSNHQLLSGLGLARQPAKGPLVPATDDDSRVFVVRLPPSQHYYSLLKAPPALANSVSKQVEVGFRSNGKPARVYHWNIPVLKKMAAARRRSTQGNGGSGSGSGGLAKPSKKPSKSKLNATRRKAAYHRVQHQQQLQPQLQLQQQQQQQQKQKVKLQLLQQEPEPAGPSPFFYAPAAKKTSMHKLLGGNGKPHTMYVLEKSRAPAYYQRLLP